MIMLATTGKVTGPAIRGIRQCYRRERHSDAWSFGRRRNHAGGTVELDEGACGIDLDPGEVVVREPGGDGGEIAVAGAEGCAEGLGREPLVIGG